MVRVTEHFFGCISFLCVEDPGEDSLTPKGAAFAVSVPDSDRPDAVHCYLITARHNLELAQTDRIFVRVNTDEGFREILTGKSMTALMWHVFSSRRNTRSKSLLAFLSEATFLITLDFRKAAQIFPYLSAQSYSLSVYSFKPQAEGAIFP
jgi:hypothetical protein